MKGKVLIFREKYLPLSFNHGGHKIWADCFFHLHYDNGYYLYMGRVGKNPFQCVRGCEMHLQKHFWCKLRPTIIISLCYPIVSLVCDEKTLQLPTWRNLASNMIALHKNRPVQKYWIVSGWIMGYDKLFRYISTLQV